MDIDVVRALHEMVPMTPTDLRTFLLTIIGLNGWVAALSATGSAAAAFMAGLYWVLRNYFQITPLDRDRIALNAVCPLLLTQVCWLAAVIGGYASLSADLVFGAIQVGIAVGFGPYLLKAAGKSAVDGSKSAVQKARRAVSSRQTQGRGEA